VKAIQSLFKSHSDTRSGRLRASWRGGHFQKSRNGTVLKFPAQWRGAEGSPRTLQDTRLSADERTGPMTLGRMKPWVGPGIITDHFAADLTLEI